jgi:DNA-binding NtrC family response regulator
MDGSKRTPAPDEAQVSDAAVAVLVGDVRDWPSDLESSLGRDGYAVRHVRELSLVPALLAEGRMRALFVGTRPLAASDLLVLRHVRETSPRTAVVVVSGTPTQPDLKRAFESGATAFLSWPLSIQSLRQAMESGTVPPPGPGGPPR